MPSLYVTETFLLIVSSLWYTKNMTVYKIQFINSILNILIHLRCNAKTTHYLTKNARKHYICHCLVHSNNEQGNTNYEFNLSEIIYLIKESPMMTNNSLNKKNIPLV